MTIYLNELRSGVGSSNAAYSYASRSHPSSIGKRLLASASASVMTVLLASAANAQALPVGCVSDVNPLAPGATITCIAAAPTVIGDIVTNVDDLTIVIGDASTPTTVGTIVATSSGGGVTVESSAGDVLGGSYGIDARSYGDDPIDVTAGVVTGGNVGIRTIVSDGATTITLTSTAEVTGTNAQGINASSTGAMADIKVQGMSGDIVGGTDGLDIDTMGADILVQNLDSVTGNAGDGIDAVSNGGDITIMGVDTILGTSGDGIMAISGGGNISIQDSGRVDGISGVGPVSFFSAFNGIVAISDTGAINIGDAAAIGEVTGMGNSSVGIYASSGGGITIDSRGGTVTGGTGIRPLASGTGGISVMTADVIGSGISGNGVNAFITSGSEGNISIDTTAGSVSAGFFGIFAASYGTSSISVTTADVTSSPGRGISVSAGLATNTGHVSVNSAAGSVTAGDIGIQARTKGLGGISVTSADVTATSGNGIEALVQNTNNQAGIQIDSTEGSVTGSTAGIFAFNSGAGAVSVTSAGVTGTTRTGITARSDGGGVTLDSSAGDVLGGLNGIVASDSGGGAVSVTSAGVTGTAQSGIYAFSDGGGVTVDSSAGDVLGGLNGIVASDSGGGAVSVTSAGVTGTAQSGIYAYSDGGGVTVDIDGNVTGGGHGILTDTQNGTNLTLAAGHTISGGIAGIETRALGGSSTSNDTLNIMGTVNGTVTTHEGDDMVTLADGSIVNGAIMLGDGMDSVVLNDAAFGALRGGGDVDTIDFNAVGIAITSNGDANDAVAEFETYNFNADGAVLAGTNTGLVATNFNAGNAQLMGSLASANVNVATGADLMASDGTIITGSLNNNGSLGINMGGTGTLAIDGDFNQNAGSELTLDILGVGNSDMISVTGDTALAGTLNLNQFGAISETITLIDGSGAITNGFTAVNGLQNGLLISQSLVIDAATSNLNLENVIVDATTINGLTPNQAIAANALAAEFETGNLNAGLTDLVLGLDSASDVNDLSTLLDELPPEIVNANIDGLRLRQATFRQLLLAQYNRAANAADEADQGFSNLGSGSIADGAQIWSSVGYSEYRNDSVTNNTGYKGDGIAFAAGISNIGAGAWKLGVAGGYSDFDTNSLRGVQDQASSKFYQFGIQASGAFSGGNMGIDGHVDLAVTYGTGDSDLVMQVGGALPGLGAVQFGNANFDAYGASFQLNLDGTNGKLWPVRPFISIAYDRLSQDSVTLAGAGVTDLVIDQTSLDRVTFGYGLRLSQVWDATTLNLGASGYHYTGDTQTNLNSRFVETGGSGTPFNTLGYDIRNQFKIDGGLAQDLGSGWNASADGFYGFGDIEGFGGAFKLTKRF